MWRMIAALLPHSKLRIRSDRGSLVLATRVLGNIRLLRIVLGAQVGQDRVATPYAPGALDQCEISCAPKYSDGMPRQPQVAHQQTLTDPGHPTVAADLAR